MKIGMYQILRNKRNGFSLVETIFSLIIISVAFSLISCTFWQIRKDNQQRNQIQQFYQYLDVLESDDFQFTVVKCENNNVELHSLKESKNYNLKKYKNVIKLSGENGGYMPLIMNIKSAQWFLKNHELFSRVVIGEKQIEAKIKIPEQR